LPKPPIASVAIWGSAYQMYDDLVDFVGEEGRIGKTLGTDLATGKLTLPLMLLLEQVAEGERAAIITAMRGGQPLGLLASRQRMQELGIATGVVLAIEAELALAGEALAPYARLAPVPLMLQLGGMLRTQVVALSGAVVFTIICVCLAQVRP
jgi:octaprenyl-diphosphate synthase